MTGSLRTLLQQSLDYAGVFPPAALSMSQAAATFLRERSGPGANLLSRFVCPPSRLAELATSLPAGAPPVRIAAILRGGKIAGECLANLEADLATLAAAQSAVSNSLFSDTLELKLPVDSLEPSPLRKVLSAIIALVGRQPGAVRLLYLEIAPSPLLDEQLEQLAESDRELREAVDFRLGYKLRTGGNDASSVPSVAQVATALAAAHAHGLPMKCTGGLHHPLRGRYPCAEYSLHGFVNLLVAAAFLHCRRLPTEVLEAALAEGQASSFHFAEQSMQWNNLTLTSAELAAAREAMLITFGSCYADIPQTELRRLGWWG